MKFFAASILIFVAVFTADAQSPYTIRGNVKGAQENTEIILYQNNGNLLSPVAKDTIADGRFLFQGLVSDTLSLTISFRDDNFPSGWLDVWVAPNSSVEISGNNNLFMAWQVKSDIRQQHEANRFKSVSVGHLDAIQKLRIQQTKLLSGREKFSEEEKKIVKLRVDSLRAAEDSVRNYIIEEELEVLARSPVSDIWLNKLKEIAMSVRYDSKKRYQSPAELLFNRLSPVQKQSLTGQEINVYLFPPTVVSKGEKMPDTNFNDLEGNVKTLNDYKGKYLLLDFWSVGCGPCMMAMPELKELSEKYEGQLTIVGISMDVKKEVWQKASRSEAISWVNLNDYKGMAGIAARYGVNGIPHYVLISPDGVVVDLWVGYRKGLLAEKLKPVLQVAL